jgi:hypothetical protein
MHGFNMSPVTSCSKFRKAVMTSDNNISTWENTLLMVLRVKLNCGKRMAGVGVSAN